jgi:hypothetical protein
MPISKRQDIKHFITTFFNHVETPQTIEDCVNAYIKSRNLESSFHLRECESKTSKNTSSNERIQLRDQITQELRNIKQIGLIIRLRYGVYIKRSN